MSDRMGRVGERLSVANPIGFGKIEESVNDFQKRMKAGTQAEVLAEYDKLGMEGFLTRMGGDLDGAQEEDR